MTLDVYMQELSYQQVTQQRAYGISQLVSKCYKIQNIQPCIKIWEIQLLPHETLQMDNYLFNPLRVEIFLYDESKHVHQL